MALKILFIIALIMITMLITIYVVFRNQFNAKANKIDNELDGLNNLFQKRQETLQAFFRECNHLLESSDVLNPKTEMVLKCLNKIDNEPHHNNALTEYKALDNTLNEFLDSSNNLCSKMDNTTFSNYINQLQHIQQEIKSKIESYNYAVRIYNITLNIFPAKYVANLMHLTNATEY